MTTKRLLSAVVFLSTLSPLMAQEPIARRFSDPMALRQALVFASQPTPTEKKPSVDKTKPDASLDARLKAALAQAKANDPAAFPVLIELLAVLPVSKRVQAEEVLLEWAGEWAPAGGPAGEDEIARRIRRDAWAAWWANTDGPALLAMIHKRTLSPEEQKKVMSAIRRLGDSDYTTREKAVNELVARGRMILPILREAIKNNELEVVRRAQGCIQRIDEEPGNRLPAPALRLLGLRKPAGAAEGLLAYLPFAEEDNLVDVQASLVLLAQENGKPSAGLMKALADPQPLIRAGAAEALAVGGGVDARPAVRKLLTDDDLNVRRRTALALAPRDAKAILPLIEMIALVPTEESEQIHDFLSALAGEQSPVRPAETPESRKKSSAAWLAWWKDNEEKADLTKLTEPDRHSRLGYTTICEWNTGRILELDRERKIRWQFNGTQSPVDAVVAGNHVLVCEFGGSRVTERDFKGNIIWSKQVNGSPHNVQRLRNGHTFICTNTQMLELDRTAKQVVFTLDVNNLGQNFGQFTGAYKTKKNQIVCMQGAMCRHLDATGKPLKSFQTNIGGGAYMDLLPNGRILIAQNGGNAISEYEPDGKLTLQLNINSINGVTGLPNGHVLAASNTTGKISENDRTGKEIWSFTAMGPFRARGR